jgi:hypothetical protein
MKNPVDTFGTTASALSKNPLGIIALFIVLVYGLASMVTVFAGSLALAERLPLVCFLVLFPVAVLAVFYLLVTRHTRVLYAPGDFKDETLYVDLVSIPGPVAKALASNKFSVETEEASYSHAIDKKKWVTDFDAGKLTLTIREYPSLTHQVGPRDAKGARPVRVFLEFYDDAPNVASSAHRAEFAEGNIAAVHYVLHESFGKRLLTSTSRKKGFEVWLSIWGEFTIIAVVEHKNGSVIALSRYLDWLD